MANNRCAEQMTDETNTMILTMGSGDGIRCSKELRDIVFNIIHTTPNVTAEQSVPQRKQELQDSFDPCMIQELQYYIKEEVTRNCYGCYIQHPSQKQHNYCLSELEENIDCFIDTAYHKMDPFDVLEKWYPILHDMQLDEVEAVEACLSNMEKYM